MRALFRHPGPRFGYDERMSIAVLACIAIMLGITVLGLIQSRRHRADR